MALRLSTGALRLVSIVRFVIIVVVTTWRCVRCDWAICSASSEFIRIATIANMVVLLIQVYLYSNMILLILSLRMLLYEGIYHGICTLCYNNAALASGDVYE